MGEGFPRQFGKYHLLSPLAQGGMGALYLAVTGSSGLEKLCVIKTVLPHLADSEYVARFRDEAKVVVRLSHGNLVPVFDAGEVNREIFLAMDFVEGKDLRAVWNRCAKKAIAFPVDVAVYIVKELCRGLAYAHSFGELKLVHRDVSPPNVLISYTGEVKLTDFGLASSTLKLEKTTPGVIYGKVSYMSPEQARGEPLDARTDLYAAGIILWELLTGRQLFPAGEAQAVDLLARAKDPSPDAPSRRASRVPAALDALVLKALAVRPGERYQNGEEMRAALAGFLASEAPATDSARVSSFMGQLFGEDMPKERDSRDAMVAEVREKILNGDEFDRTSPSGVSDLKHAPKRRATDKLIGLPKRRQGDQEERPPGSSHSPTLTIGTPQAGGPVNYRAVTVVTPPPVGAPTMIRQVHHDGSSAAIQRAPMENDSQGVVGAVIDGRYHVIRLIGEGGMGRVYEAEHVEIGKRVALKILHPAYSRTPDVVERFRREARAASKIGHPNIVDVFDSGQTADGSVYFAMEHLEGVELADVIDREGALNPNRAVAITTQICRALKAAHDAGIIHRDLKPENVFLVVRDNTADFVKVLDFGIAKVADLEEPRTSRLTHPGMAMGTPEYMAPEQAAGKPADPRSDVYSLGAILYEMVVGTPPYSGDNFMEILSKKASQEPRKVRELKPELPEMLEQVIEKAMARDPAVRPQTMETFEYELTKCFAGRGFAVARLLGLPSDGHDPVPDLAPVSASGGGAPASAPSQPTESVWEQPRRSRGWLWFAAAIVLGGGGAVGYKLWRDRQAKAAPQPDVLVGTPPPGNPPAGLGTQVVAPVDAALAAAASDATVALAAQPDAAPVADVKPDPPVQPDKPDKPDKPYRPVVHKVDAKKLLSQARAAEASMQWGEAKDAYTRVLESGAARGAALTGLASVAWQTKDLDKTIDLAKQAIKAGGGTKARMLLGHAYFKQRDFTAAANEYEAVLKQHPDDREAQNALSAAKQKGGLN